MIAAGEIPTDLLLRAYATGIFPMAIEPEGEIAWFSPDPRAIIPLDDRFHVSHGLRRVLRRQRFQVTLDLDFAAVVHACATSHGSTWISPTIERTYCRLFREGCAHSIETRLDGRLVGGLYGVQLGGAFFGESMFHHETDASKVALVSLVEKLRAGGFLLLDTQWTTPHLEQFGTCQIPRVQYLLQLQDALKKKCVLS